MDPDYLKDLFEPFGPVNPRRMFGGIGVFHDGVMIALVADGQVFMKADDRTITMFENAGSSPFVYSGRGKPVRMSYWSLPEDAYDDPDILREWAGRAYSAALRSSRDS